LTIFDLQARYAGKWEPLGMYEALDSYLGMGTWQTISPPEDQQFYRAIALIVREPDFDAASMGEYMRRHESYVSDPLGQFDSAIAQRVVEAHAICDFLKLGRQG
jgi:hypothetical protein